MRFPSNHDRIIPPNERCWPREEGPEECDVCRGEGEYRGKPCKTCKGTGLSAELLKAAEEEEQYEEWHQGLQLRERKKAKRVFYVTQATSDVARRVM